MDTYVRVSEANLFAGNEVHHLWQYTAHEASSPESEPSVSGRAFKEAETMKFHLVLVM